MNSPVQHWRMPRFIRRHALYFEGEVDAALANLAGELPEAARVLDAGAWEVRRVKAFPRQRYTAVDNRNGEREWDYRGLDAAADLFRLPFRDGSFDASVSVMALQHMAEPAAAIAELARVMAPGAPLALATPLSWEVGHVPRDYFRFTRYGLRLLLERAGFRQVHVYPVGGFFRLLARRLLNALEFLPVFWAFAAGIVVVPLSLLLPVCDALDRERNLTLGYLCTAKKPS